MSTTNTNSNASSVAKKTDTSFRGMINPSKFSFVEILFDNERSINGATLMSRARKLNSMEAPWFDFFSKPENWKYLPTTEEPLCIIFPKKIIPNFKGGNDWVGSFCCYGYDNVGWHVGYFSRWADCCFSRGSRVATFRK